MVYPPPGDQGWHLCGSTPHQGAQVEICPLPPSPWAPWTSSLGHLAMAGQGLTTVLPGSSTRPPEAQPLTLSRAPYALAVQGGPRA